MALTEKAKSLRREYFRKYRKEHREQLNSYQRAWNKKHPEKANEYRQRYWEKKLAEAEAMNEAQA